MARFALAVAICATAFCVGQTGAQSAAEVDKGIDMGSKAATGMCWYEYLKVKPDKNPKADKYGSCYKNLSLRTLMKQFEAQGVTSSNYKAIKSNLPRSYNNFIKAYAPIQYSKCQDYMAEPEKEFKKDYSAILGDGSESYPYRGWAHCLVNQIEETHGKEALEAMKEKWSSPTHPWINEVYNRENENRDRHGSPPMKLNDELNARAQKWADQLAERCPPLTPEEHIQKDNPDATYNGKQTGENIAQLGVDPPVEDGALSAADLWYEEIRDYPWPEYKGDGTDPTFFKIGHFTGSMWKGIEQVGYGLGRREGCDKTYVVGRYWPAGNVVGQFKDNVAPPTS